MTYSHGQANYGVSGIAPGECGKVSIQPERGGSRQQPAKEFLPCRSSPTGRRLLCRAFINFDSVLFEVDDCAVCSIKHHPSLQHLGFKSEDMRKELAPSGQLWPGVHSIALQDTQTPKRSLSTWASAISLQPFTLPFLLFFLKLGFTTL